MPKKMSAKLVTEKVVAQKKAPVKRLSIKQKTTSQQRKRSRDSAKTSSQKTRTLLVADVDGEQLPVSIHDNTNVAKTIERRTPLVPLVRSPYRFPLPQQTSVSLVARVVGLCFVLAGSLLSIVFVNDSVASFVGLDTGALHANLIDGSTSGSTSGSTTVDPDPAPQVTIQLTQITGTTIPLQVTVPYASEVKIIADNRSLNQLFFLGYATRVDDTTWRYTWNFSGYHTGPYRIKMMIRNEFGAYDYTDSQEFELPDATNNTGETTFTTETTGTVAASSTTSTELNTTATTTTVTQSIQILLDNAEELSGAEDIIIESHGAQEVKLYAKNTKTLTSHYIGKAEKRDESKWRIRWDTKTIPNGEYRLTGIALFSTTVSENDTVSVYVENDTASSETTTASTTATSSEESDFKTDEDTLLAPVILLKTSKSSPLSGFVDVIVTTQNVEWVEVYVRPKSGLTPYFLGLAQKRSESEWRYAWETKQSPNGDYELYVRVRTKYGFVDGPKMGVRVLNEFTTTLTPDQEKIIDVFREVDAEKTVEVDGVAVPEEMSSSTKQSQDLNAVYIEPTESFIKTIEQEANNTHEIEEALNEFRSALREKINMFADAFRREDSDEISAIQTEIDKMQNDAVAKIATLTDKKEILDSVRRHLSQVIFESLELTKKNETLLKERIGTAVLEDADKDGISNYDELHLYKTSPFTADTDGDGYIDSAEIQSGFDPHDARREALVQYESPKETGVTREDLLSVDTVSTIAPDPESVSAEKLQALISGKGLPNSFITLYIFSTPIVVTVKTDENGNWSYILDKDIEEGNHEVYVGITDNAGRIVAKSNAFPFVKTAEAFTEPAGPAPVSATTGEPTFVNAHMSLLIGSIFVVLLGVILILLGVHVQNGRRAPVQQPV